MNTAHAQNCRPASVSEVAAGIYVRPGSHGILFQDAALANIGFIVGESCVAVIDSGGSAAEGAELACAIKKITPLPVCYVIISHHHPDHALGSIALRDEQTQTQFIGHVNLERALLLSGEFFLQRLQQQLDQELGADYIVLPDRTVAPDKPLRLDLGRRIVQISAHPPAHTDNDLSIYDEQTGTLWLSDLLFVEHIPAIDTSARGWLQVLQTLSDQSAQRAIPGHGPITATWPDAAQAVIRYLSVLREDVRKLLDDGADLQEAQDQAGYSEQPHWQLFEAFHKRNVTKVYTEMEWEE